MDDIIQKEIKDLDDRLRSESLTVLERCELLESRKVLWEVLNPEEAKASSRSEAESNRRIVLARSKGRCETCGMHCPVIIQVHHIKAVSSGGRGNSDNLIALCPNCHAIVHEYLRLKKCHEDVLYGFSIWLENNVKPETFEKLTALFHSRNEPDFSRQLGGSNG